MEGPDNYVYINYPCTCVYPAYSLPLTYSNFSNIPQGHIHRFIQPATRIDSYKLVVCLDIVGLSRYVACNSYRDMLDN